MSLQMNQTVKKNYEEWAYLQRRAQEGREYYYAENRGEALMPHTICISVNNVCFMRCKMCDVGQTNRERRQGKQDRFFFKRVRGEDRKHEISLEVLKKLVDDVAPYGSIIRANFLEPLLRTDLIDFAEYTIAKGLAFYLITNGFLLPKRAEDIVRVGTRALRVSLEGTSKVHNEIRGIPNSFQRAVEGIRRVIEKKKELNLTFPLLGVCFTVSDYNYNNILELFRELKKEGIFENIYVAINFLKYNTADEAGQQSAISEEFFPLTRSSMDGTDIGRIDVKELIRQIAAIEKEFPHDRYKYHFNPLLNGEEIMQWFDGRTYLHPNIPCFAPWTVAQIFYNGDVGINGRCISPNFGNILTSSFPEIWNSEIAKSFRQFLKQNPKMPACNRCSRVFTEQK